MDQAMSNLGQGGAEEWESVVAAAAVVAAGVTSGNMRSHTQFAVDDNVLVFLNVLNHTNSVDSREVFTVNPVNKYGFPRGEGKTTQEQHGPYVYVLATVKKVHFDEDLRYYTVARADCGTEQRADTGKRLKRTCMTNWTRRLTQLLNIVNLSLDGASYVTNGGGSCDSGRSTNDAI